MNVGKLFYVDGQVVNVSDFEGQLSLQQLLNSAIVGKKQPGALCKWVKVPPFQYSSMNDTEIWIAYNFHMS